MTTPSHPGAGDGPVEPTPPQQPPAPPQPGSQPQPPYQGQPQPPYQGQPDTIWSGQGTPPGSPPPVTFEGQTFPGAAGQPEPKKSGVKKGLLLGGVAALTLAVAGGAVYAGTQLSGGGKQPEDVLPKDAMAFAKLDFDPAAGQKIALYRLAQKFPDAKVKSEEGVKDDLLSQLFEGDEDVDYAKDIQPWIGDRVGVVALPDSDDEGDEPDAMVAIAFSDEDAAKKSLPKLSAAGDKDDPAFYAFSEAGDYVLFGETQKAVDAAAKGKAFLADDKAFGTSVDALEGDQIITVWADAEAIWGAIPAKDKADVTETYGKDFNPKGQFIAGLHADASFLEMTGRGIDLTTGVDIAQLGAGKGTGLLREFPEDLLAGMSVTGLGETLSKGFDQFSEAIGDGADVQSFEDEIGIKLPEDLKTLLGEETAIGVYGTQDDPQVVGRTRGGDADAALAIAEKLRKAAQAPPEPTPSSGDGPTAEECDELINGGLAEEIGLTIEEATELCSGPSAPASPTDPSKSQGAVKKHDGGLAFGLTQEAVDKVAADGKLGAKPAFAKALPDADGATFLLYADLDRIVSMFGEDIAEMDDDGKFARNAKVLQSVGMSAKGSENGEFRLRVTVK